jgi:hypothetical protein
LVTGEQLEIPLDVVGPMSEFILSLDLRRNEVEIRGRAKNRFLLAVIKRQGADLVLFFPKEKKTEYIVRGEEPVPMTEEILSLGMNKQLDWELVRRRADAREIFPVWFSLGQKMPRTPPVWGGTATLLRDRPEKTVLERLTLLFRVGFEGLMTPRLIDDDLQGIVPHSGTPPDGSPLFLLTEGVRQIRVLFFREEKMTFHLLPELPPEFHSGRLYGLMTEAGDRLDIEWSKKLLRRVTIRLAKTRSLSLVLQRELKSFRLRTSYKARGARHDASMPLVLEEGHLLYLDRFQK